MRWKSNTSYFFLEPSGVGITALRFKHLYLSFESLELPTGRARTATSAITTGHGGSCFDPIVLQISSAGNRWFCPCNLLKGRNSQ